MIPSELCTSKGRGEVQKVTSGLVPNSFVIQHELSPYIPRCLVAPCVKGGATGQAMACLLCLHSMHRHRGGK